MYSKNKILVAITVCLMIMISLNACDESQFLDEQPSDFLTPGNSFRTFADFESAVFSLYGKTRDNFVFSASENDFPALAWSGVDMVYQHKNDGVRPDWGGAQLLPTRTSVVQNSMWRPAFEIIFDANVIINRAEESQMSESEKTDLLAQAHFFRGFMYKMLANLYGGVPIVLEETTEPKRDFNRASRLATYEQSAADLEFAAENLPEIDVAGDTKLNNLAAFNVLSEVYISLERWEDAISAATTVIDNPSTALMRERFGTMVDHPFLGGDVYWDLFRQGNVNRSTGNTETIWALQFALNVPGGQDGGFLLERLIIPRVWQAKIENNDGSTATIVPNPNTFVYGRGSGFMSPSYFLHTKLWERSGEGDIRNSEHNIVRDLRVRNPQSDFDGQFVMKDDLPISLISLNDTTRNFFPIFAKASTVAQHPQEVFLENPTVEGGLSNDARRTYRNRYVFRLAETYLLRAEAYLGNGNMSAASEDINVVRRRAKAPEITPGEVDIDYILDERLRELHFESFRLLTLTRLDMLVERTREVHPWVGDTYLERNNLWPIPFDEIEKNSEGDLTQNPGY